MGKPCYCYSHFCWAPGLFVHTCSRWPSFVLSVPPAATTPTCCCTHCCHWCWCCSHWGCMYRPLLSTLFAPPPSTCSCPSWIHVPTCTLPPHLFILILACLCLYSHCHCSAHAPTHIPAPTVVTAAAVAPLPLLLPLLLLLLPPPLLCLCSFTHSFASTPATWSHLLAFRFVCAHLCYFGLWWGFLCAPQPLVYVYIKLYKVSKYMSYETHIYDMNPG